MNITTIEYKGYKINEVNGYYEVRDTMFYTLEGAMEYIDTVTISEDKVEWNGYGFVWSLD